MIGVTFEEDDIEEESEDAGPPQLCPEELQELEKEADETELNRLLEMEVLIPADPNNLDGYRFLTTKSVYDWRWRMLEETGKFGWKRRFRLVGRDYKFMNPEMENLFSPTSNAIGTKLWAALVQSSGGELELWSVDVKDAYLMVPQEEKVYVEYNGNFYVLGRCLPGQRVGSKAWYEHLGQIVTEECGLKPYAANPALFYRPGKTPLVMSAHVDDLQIVGGERDVKELLDTFEKHKWVLQVEGPCSPQKSGQCSFLKRHFASDGKGNMTIKIDGKYVKKLVNLLGLQENKGKTVPTTTTFHKGLEGKPVSQEDASLYRTCVGILLYMSTERPDIQCAIRQLASKVTAPDSLAFKELRQTVLYLKETKDYIQQMDNHNAMDSAVPNEPKPPDEEAIPATTSPSLLQVFTDSDWASDRETRRSMSCAHFYLNGIFFWSSTRTQKSIALSSCEAEFISAVSGLADGIYVKRMLETVLGMQVRLELRIDSSSARALLQRQGLQRTRHISTGLLWVQQKVAEREALVKPIPGKENSSDLGTKAHSAKRLRYLMRLLNYREFADGPFVGEEEQEIRAVRGVRPERIHQLTCVLLAALSQQVAGSTSSTTSTSSSLQPGQPVQVPFLVAVAMMLFNLQGCDLAVIMFTSAAESIQTMFIEAWRQFIVPAMFCYGMFFLAKFLSERCCGQEAQESDEVEWTETDEQEWREIRRQSWKSNGWQEWTEDEWQQWQREGWQNRDWQQGDWQQGDWHQDDQGDWHRQQPMHRRSSAERFNVFGEPHGHDPQATGSRRDGELWEEPDGGDIRHLLEGAEENEDGANSTGSNGTTMYDWDPVSGEMRNFRILRNGETPFPGEDYFVPDGNGSYVREHADTDEEDESSEDEDDGAEGEEVRRIEEFEFEHPMIFMQDDRPGLMFEVNDQTNELRTYRILDPNIDEPETDEEYFVDTIDGYPRWQRCFQGEPEGEHTDQVSSPPRRHGRALGNQEHERRVARRMMSQENPGN